MGKLDGRIALVTGGSRGIGRAIAGRFAKEGANVVITHVGDAGEAAATLAAIAAATGRQMTAIESDVAVPAANDELIDNVIDTHGRVDVLVNNAGVLSPERAGATFDASEFGRTLAINLTGVASLSARTIAHFIARPGGGTIINTTSVHETVPKPGYLPYAMSKAGVGMLTRTLALEYAGQGIRVNAVGPGAVDTSMNDSWRHDAAQRARISAHIPMGFAAQADDIAGVYAFLASDDARYITGQTIYACGGLTLHNDFRNNWSS